MIRRCCSLAGRTHERTAAIPAEVFRSAWNYLWWFVVRFYFHSHPDASLSSNVISSEGTSIRQCGVVGSEVTPSSTIATHGRTHRQSPYDLILFLRAVCLLMVLVVGRCVENA